MAAKPTFANDIAAATAATSPQPIAIYQELKITHRQR